MRLIIAALFTVSTAASAATFAQLSLAIANDDRETVMKLCRAEPALLAESDGGGNTVAHLIAMSGNIDLLKLVDRDLDNDRANANGLRPIHFALINSSPKLASFFADKGAKVDIFCAAAMNNTQQLKAEISKNPSLLVETLDGMSLVHWATLADGTDTLLWLLSRGANVQVVGAKGATPLHLAASRNNVRMMSVLLKSSANVNAQDEQGRSPLFSAVLAGATEATAALVESGSLVSIEDRWGNTPMVQASIFGRLDLVRLLLDGSTLKDRRESLIQAACEGHTPVISIIIKSGVSPNFKLRGSSPLTCAVLRNHIDDVRKLTEFDADVNEYDDNNQTPLHIAAENGSVDIMKVLMARGADIELLDSRGRRAIDLATRAHQSGATELLANALKQKTREPPVEKGQERRN